MKASHVLMFVGFVVLLVSVVWFLSFFPDGSITSQNMQNSIKCLYSNPIECQIAYGMLTFIGGIPYNHLVFWVGLIMMVVGVIMKIIEVENEGKKNAISNSTRT